MSLNRLAKDVVKAVKKRLQHKKPKVQLLALTVFKCASILEKPGVYLRRDWLMFASYVSL